MKKFLPKIIIVFVIMALVLIVILSLNDINEIGKVLSQTSIPWLFGATILLLSYILLNPLSLFLLGKSKEEASVSLTNSMMIGTMEYFFNGITPFSAGGQPFQIYAYRQIDVKTSRASGMILMNFVATQTAIVILCLSSLFFFDKLTLNQLHLKILIWIGLIINIFILTFFIIVGVSKHLRDLLIRFARWFFCLKIFKGKLEKRIFAFENYCAGAQSTFKALSKQKIKFIFCIAIKVAAFIVYYMIPFFILKSLRIEVKALDIPLIVAMTTFSVAMTCYIPTPGAAGGIEFAFQSLFVTIISSINDSIAASGVLLWRFITYYLLMLISFIVYLIFEKIVLRKQKLTENEEDNKLENENI